MSGGLGTASITCAAGGGSAFCACAGAGVELDACVASAVGGAAAGAFGNAACTTACTGGGKRLGAGCSVGKDDLGGARIGSAFCTAGGKSFLTRATFETSCWTVRTRFGSASGVTGGLGARGGVTGSA